MTTKIIATIGPASNTDETLEFFTQHGVEIARLNFSHGTADWHRETAAKCRKHGLKIMFDLAGPKVLLGELAHTIEITRGNSVILEHAKDEQVYPYPSYNEGKETMVLPCQFDIDDFVTKGGSIYIDDGKIKLEVTETKDNRVYCTIINGGVVKSNKGINIPGADPNITFIVDKDRHLLAELFAEVQPDIIAVSFVRYEDDLHTITDYLKELLQAHGVTDYFPQICSKIEQQQAVSGKYFKGILEHSDIIMIARGDLAIETEPVHLTVPFYQDHLVDVCKTNNTPVIIATQILESMMSSQVPTRSEVSDLYRAIVHNKAEYVMLSAETAAGQFPHEAVKLMYDMSVEHEKLEELVNKELGSLYPLRITIKQK
jgi:pyruvate kinase